MNVDRVKPQGTKEDVKKKSRLNPALSLALFFQ
jgi:hypothetical protein